jgi:hypothetical protein
MKYKVVPLDLKITKPKSSDSNFAAINKQSANQTAKEFEVLLMKHSESGWLFDRVHTLNTNFGSYDVVIFKKSE